MDDNMFNNPLIQRYRYSLLRPNQFWMYQVMYFGIIGMIVLINVLIYYNSLKEKPMIFKWMYYQILIFETLIMWFWTTHNSNQAIRNEKRRKTYDFFKMMPVSSNRKAAGILVGANLVALLFAAYNFILLIVLGFLGKMNFRTEAYNLLAILSVALLLNSVSLLSSTKTDQKQAQSSVAALVFLGLILAPMMISGVGALAESGGLSSSVRFYFLDIPIPLTVSIISLYFFFWSFSGVVRRFNYERRPLFTYHGALLFMAGFCILTGGFYWPYMDKAGLGVLYSFWLIIFIPLLLIPFGAARSYNMYLEGLRQSEWDRKGSTMTWILFRNSNLFVWLSLFLIWALFSMGMGLKSGGSPGPFMLSIVMMLSFVLFFSTLFELQKLYEPAYSKIKGLMVLVLLIYLLIPLIISGILNNGVLFMYSPVGYISFLFAQNSADMSMKFPTGVLLQNIILCAISVSFILHKYNQIIDVRREMKTQGGSLKY